jgi:hypothetical protein
MSRAELERRVDELAEAHSGRAFADAVRRFSESLDEHEQEELKAVLLERARLLEDAVGERFEAHGWFRRTWREAGDLGRRQRDR